MPEVLQAKTEDTTDESEEDNDIHLLIATDEPDSFTSYEELAERYKAWMNYEHHDDSY